MELIAKICVILMVIICIITPIILGIMVLMEYRYYKRRKLKFPDYFKKHKFEIAVNLIFVSVCVFLTAFCIFCLIIMIG